MARPLSTNKLIDNIKLRSMLPATNVTFKPEDFLSFVSDEMDMGIVPHVMSYHEDYLLDTVQLSITADQTRYKIPNRAVGNKVRDVRYRDNSNGLFEMTRVQKEDEMYYQYNIGGGGALGLRPFMIEADEIVLLQGTVPGLGGFLEIVYYLRPNQLVTEDTVCKVTSINTVTNVVGIDKYPTNFDGETTFDITSSKSPYKLVAMDIVPTSLPSSTNLFFTFSTLPKNLNIGDIIALQEETIIPQVPVELHSMLAQRVAIRCLEALGDTQGLTNAMAKLQEMEAKTGSIIDDRVEGSPKKVINFHTFLRRTRSRI